jgi:hypothetical protein
MHTKLTLQHWNRWDAIKALPRVRTVYVHLPMHIFGQNVTFFAHHSDVIRLHALLRFGGIFVAQVPFLLGALCAPLSDCVCCVAYVGVV